MKLIFSWIMMMVLLACTNSPNYNIDLNTHKATAYNNRVRFIVMHYTAGSDEGSLRTLTGPNVSSHYLVTTKMRDPIYKLLPEEKRAWHAGISEFQGRTNLNDNSIGIEIVNKGYRVEGDKRIFYPYEEGQILKVAHLLRGLVDRYNIDPTRIVGHSDISPDRKQDPGPFFPWERLYREYGLGAWYDMNYMRNVTAQEYSAASIEDIQRLFRNYGYPIRVDGEWSEYNTKVVRAFQMHFRPRSYSGEMDIETYAIIKSLNKKYVKK